ncbi:SURF1 family protein [Microbispora bryophytorum]|uniref:SURF1-like protein n=1 Tax=Microbispora bryophytorum TaxID=1460882 RepID=A0A8H9H1C8_9ACTN|nr:SURF1 family protein [Microbispora bryophytorum]MBD3136372.1 SURF1 family protein [Microbispora bryophytorum]TQS08089.1 SURF1 family protein [Microbispora bryophytorum]GGO05921.1 SURF1-like protein [Microbispora bryophytorum]
MLRTLLAPRLVALHLLVIGVLVSFTFLGRWQLGVFEASGGPRRAPDPAPVAVTELTQVGQHIGGTAISRRVTATGTYDAANQLLVADRVADVAAPGGRAARGSGFWLLTPLRLTDGTVVSVVRGWVPTVADPATAVPEGTVTVMGRLRPAEQTDDVVRSGNLPRGQVATVSTAELINVWPEARVRDGFLVATAQQPPSRVTPVAVSAPTEGGGFNWRNLAYALQWWIFALFAVYMWFHFVRDALRGQRERKSEEPQPAGPAAQVEA